MIKVFHIISHFDIGGAERVAVNIAKSKSDGFEYHVVEVIKSSSDYRRNMINEMKELNIHYHCSPIPNNKLAIVLFPFWFVWLYLRKRPQIIHTHTEVPDLAIYIFYNFFFWIGIKSKFIRTIHNNQLWNSWEKIGEKVEKFYIRNHSNIVISKSTQNSYRRIYGELCPIVYNGLDVVQQKSFEGIKVGKINVLYAARLEYQKCPEILAEVIREMQYKEHLYFHIIGDGSMRDFLLSKLEGCNNYSYYNKVYGLSSYLSSFDYLFMPSKFEGLALMPIEASFAKVPSIINDCLGLADTLPDDWPLKVNDNDLNAYKRIFNSLEKNKNLGEIAYKFATEHFAMKQMQKQYEEIYEKKWEIMCTF